MFNGDFWRSHYLNMRLVCAGVAELNDGQPQFDCPGYWYEPNGVAGGQYRGRLFYTASRSRWELKGEYNNQENPDQWIGHNYSHTE